MKDVPARIRSDKLWKDVYELVVSIYGKISDLIADFPDEEWATASKLRNAANDSLFYTSQAIGNSSAEASLFDWNNARKNLFSLQAMYTFASKQKFLELEPDVIVRIDDMLAEIDKRITEANTEMQMRNKEELEPWLEKYRIWQEMQK